MSTPNQYGTTVVIFSKKLGKMIDIFNTLLYEMSSFDWEDIKSTNRWPNCATSEQESQNKSTNNMLHSLCDVFMSLLHPNDASWRILCRQFQKYMTTIEFNQWIIIVWMNYFSRQPAESCNHHPQKEYAKIISQQLALYITCNLQKNNPLPSPCETN